MHGLEIKAFMFTRVVLQSHKSRCGQSETTLHRQIAFIFLSFSAAFFKEMVRYSKPKLV